MFIKKSLSFYNNFTSTRNKNAFWSFFVKFSDYSILLEFYNRKKHIDLMLIGLDNSI